MKTEGQNKCGFEIEDFLRVPMVLIRFGVSPTLPMGPLFFPRRNCAGTLVFAQGLRLALKLPTSAVHQFGELNRGTVVVKCEKISAETLLDITLEMLAATMLKDYTVIAQLDVRTRNFIEHWRGRFAENIPPITPALVMADLLIDMANMAEIQKIIDQCKTP